MVERDKIYVTYLIVLKKRVIRRNHQTNILKRVSLGKSRTAKIPRTSPDSKVSIGMPQSGK